jgi:hypothetical protein
MFAERKDESQKNTRMVKSGFAVVLHRIALGTELLGEADSWRSNM